jgi:hypothetical protein
MSYSWFAHHFQQSISYHSLSSSTSKDAMRHAHWALGGQFLTAPWIQGNNRSSVTPRISGAIFAVGHGISSASHVNIALSIAQDIYLRV